MTDARYQITVDGQPRSNRDDRAIAIEAAPAASVALSRGMIINTALHN